MKISLKILLMIVSFLAVSELFAAEETKPADVQYVWTSLPSFSGGLTMNFSLKVYQEYALNLQSIDRISNKSDWPKVSEKSIHFGKDLQNQSPLFASVGKNTVECLVSYQDVAYHQVGADKNILRLLTYKGCPFTLRTLKPETTLKLRRPHVIVVESSEGRILTSKSDSSIPFLASKSSLVYLASNAIGSHLKFLRSGTVFETDDGKYKVLKDGATVRFTNEGVFLDGVKCVTTCPSYVVEKNETLVEEDKWWKFWTWPAKAKEEAKRKAEMEAEKKAEIETKKKAEMETKKKAKKAAEKQHVLQQKVNRTNQLKQNSRKHMNVFNALGRIPKETFLVNASLSGNTLKLAGLSKSKAHITTLMNMLENEDIFHSPHLDVVKKATLAGGAMKKYNIVVSVTALPVPFELATFDETITTSKFHQGRWVNTEKVTSSLLRPIPEKADISNVLVNDKNERLLFGISEIFRENKSASPCRYH